MMVLWVVIIFGLTYLLLGGNFNVNNFLSKSAVNILDERLAKGEISIVEYEDLKNTLKEKR